MPSKDVTVDNHDEDVVLSLKREALAAKKAGDLELAKHLLRQAKARQAAAAAAAAQEQQAIQTEAAEAHNTAVFNDRQKQQ